MQSGQGYPIDYLLEFLDPAFPEKLAWNDGWGQSIEFQSGAVDPRETQKVLVSYLEEWIDSGRQSDGAERPYDRNFAPKSSRKIWNFEDGKPNLLPPPHAVVAMSNFFNGVPMVRDRHYLIHRSAEAHSTGSVSILIGGQGGIHFEPTRETGKTTPESFAAGLFLQFYRSEIIFRLMQCKNCRSFAVHDRPRQSYVRGWHCPKCIKKVPALISSDKARKSKRERWFNLAVEACFKLDAAREGPESEKLILSITEKVNSRLSLQNRIKRHTIARNLKDIRDAANLKLVQIQSLQ